MPSSPLDASKTEEANDHESPFRQGLKEIDDLIDRGVSLSGHERNCAFLNVPGEDSTRRFVTASAALGLDHDDDSRAIALVDWDRDGDLDLWIANRTAPMLRFIRNEGGEGTSWAGLRLQGTRANRDGIGARVRMKLDDGRVLTQTLKAGEGYLAQSSKWLHFGLGGSGKIDNVEVVWPGGRTESFAGVEANHRFRLVEGEGEARRSDRPVAVSLPLPAERVVEAADGGPVHVSTPSRWPLPRLPYMTFAGEKGYAGGRNDHFTLVNLWATWCLPCRAELEEFTNKAKILEDAGIEIVALSVDGLQMDAQTEPASSGVAPEAFYKKLGAPFTAGLASAELVRRLEVVVARLFGPRWPLPVPSSVLLDSDGAIVAFYKGAVPVERIMDDVRISGQDFERRHDASLPFEGRWFFRPKPLDPLNLGLDLMEHGEVDDALELVSRAQATFRERSTEYGQFLTWIGDELMKKQRVPEALGAYRAALGEDDANTIVLNNLAWQLAAHPDEAVRNGEEAVRWAEKAAALTKHKDPAILDTLAAAYAEVGDFGKAVAAADKAADLARRQGKRALWEGIQQAVVKYRSGRTYANP